MFTALCMRMFSELTNGKQQRQPFPITEPYEFNITLNFKLLEISLFQTKKKVSSVPQWIVSPTPV